MWNYEKRLQYPVNITQPNPKLAMIIMSQYGGPDGEAAASMRYLAQRYTMPHREIAGLLTDIGTEASKRHLDKSHFVLYYNTICACDARQYIWLSALDLVCHHGNKFRIGRFSLCQADCTPEQSFLLFNISSSPSYLDRVPQCPLHSGGR